MADTVMKTLDDIINRDDRYDINKIMFYKATDDNTLVIEDLTIVDIYYKFLLGYIAPYDVSRSQREYYRGKPYLLSLDVYGTPALAWLILKMNDRECASKFYLKATINLIPASTLSTIYDQLVTKSAKRMRANWNKYLKMVGEEAGES